MKYSMGDARDHTLDRATKTYNSSLLDVTIREDV